MSPKTSHTRKEGTVEREEPVRSRAQGEVSWSLALGKNSAVLTGAQRERVVIKTKEQGRGEGGLRRRLSQ